MIRPLALLLPLLSLHAASVQVAVDQPNEWASPNASHHGKHAIGGAVIGGASYLGARALGATRFQAWASATLIGCGAQVVYEARAGYKNGCLFDPVDIAWGTAGSSAAAGVLAGGDYAIAVLFTSDRASLGVAWRF